MPCAFRVSSTLALLIAFTAIGSASPLNSVEDEYRSKTEETIVRVYRDTSDPLGQMQLRVFRKGDVSSDGFLLWEGTNRASALVSFDGEGIAVNQHAASDLGLLFVFTRREDGTYQKIGVDFQEEVLRLFAEHERLKEVPSFDHIYCYAATWLSSHQLLGTLSGRKAGEYSLRAFWFIFDCSTKKFAFDLETVNTDAFQKSETAQREGVRAK